MAKPNRVRRVMKWAGLIISILLAETTLVTTFGYASLTLGSHLFEVSEGAIGFLGNAAPSSLWGTLSINRGTSPLTSVPVLSVR